MNVKGLARLAGIPEIEPYIDGMPEKATKDVAQCIHEIIAMTAHPSKGYRTFVIAQIIESLAEEIYPYSSADYIKMLILYRLSHYGRTVGDLTTVSDELKVMSVIWGLTETMEARENYDFLEEVVADWDWKYLKGEFLEIEPDDESIDNVAGRALYYRDTGRMTGTAGAHEARKFFGWVK